MSILGGKMKIQTSYFASKAPSERKVSIAKWSPRWFRGQRASMLAPSNPKTVEWKKAYLADLEERFPNGEGLLQYLQEIEQTTPEAILCCYEKEKGECHRSVLAEYAKEHLGIEIPEWEENKQDTLIK